MKEEIFEKVFEVFGESLPEKDIFQATNANQVSALDVRKTFGNWATFEYEYAKFLQSKKTPVKTVTPPVVTKAPVDAAN